MKRNRPARWALLAVLLTVTVLLVPVGATAQTADEADLERAREQVDRIARQLQAARQRRDAAADELARTRERLRELEAAVNAAAAAVERQQTVVQTIRERIERTRTELERRRSQFADRAADLYKHGPGGSVEAVLTAGSPQEALDRSAFAQRVLSRDRGALEQLTAVGTRLVAEQERLAAERDRLATMRTEQEALLADALRLRDQQAATLTDAEREVGGLADEREQLEAESQRLERIIAQRAAAPTVTPRAAGGYVWPLCGAVTSEFGRRWGRRHEGMDIDGSTGQPIVSANAGTVIFAGWQGGYGRLTLIDHGDGVVTAYAHQSAVRVATGQRVSAGQHIGDVGATGNVTGSHLHFETRTSSGPMDPRRYLSGGC